jgi:hypothetical protein
LTLIISLFLQFQFIQLLPYGGLPLIEEQILIVLIVAVAAVGAYE